MSGEITSANMSMPVPGVGITGGPEWANDINTCLSIIDQHDHSSGNGVAITPAGLNISSDLPFLSNNATGLRSTRFQSQPSVLGGASDLRCLYSVTNDLYFNDGAGNQIRLTQSGGVVGTPGSISNLTSPASAAYVSANSTFVFQSAANTPGNLDGASVLLRNLSANSKSLTLAPPNAMGSNYTVTLPALPGSQSFVTLDASGNMAAGTPIANGITRSMLASVGQQSGALSISSSTNSSYVAIGSVTITTSGRPVIVFTNGTYIGQNTSSGAGRVFGNIAVSNNGGASYLLIGTYDAWVALGFGYSRTPCSMMLLDTPSVGTITYTVYAQAQFGSVSVSGTVYAYEL